jgi:hypothetical protein
MTLTGQMSCSEVKSAERSVVSSVITKLFPRVVCSLLQLALFSCMIKRLKQFWPFSCNVRLAYRVKFTCAGN